MKTKDSKIVIRPGKKYLIAIFLYIYSTFMMVWVLCKVGSSEILETKWAGVLPLLLLSSSLGIYFLVFVLFTKTEVSDKKILINQFPFKRSEYLWSEISNAKIIGEASEYPCEIYSGGKRILKIPRNYFGYERLFYELDKRNVLRKDDFYVAAKVALEIDKRRRQD